MKKLMQSINKNIHKGRIALYTAIISMLMILVVFYLIPSIDNKISYITAYSSYLMQEDVVERKREIYLSDFNNYFVENFTGSTDDDIKQFMTDNREYLFSELKDKDGVKIYYFSKSPQFKLTISNSVMYVFPEISGEKMDDGHAEIKYIIMKEDELSNVP